MRGWAWRAGTCLLLATALRSADARELTALRADLEGQDDARARAAATQLGALRDAAALDALLDALALGLPSEVGVAALDAVGAARSRAGLEVLLRYARHRAPELRAHALAALSGLDDRRARAALLAALGDQDAEVRGAAGAALAARHERAAVAPLLALIGRGDAAATGPLAALADAEVARTVAELAGKVPDAIVADTLGSMLLRDGLGPETTYVSVARALGAIPGEESLRALQAFAAAAPAGSRRPSVKEARQLVERRTPGSGQ